MKVSEFISDALIEVCRGVDDAIKRRDSEGLTARISPIFLDPADQSVDWTKMIEKVEFDIAVTQAESRQVDGHGGLEVVAALKIGADGTRKSEQSSVNRIRFSIPVLYPAQVVNPK
jgi:hypothetical protein